MKNFDAIKPPNSPTAINFKPRKNRALRKLKWLLAILILIAAGTWAAAHLIAKVNQIFVNKENVFVRVGKLFIGQDKPLAGEDKGQINVLLLGIGGPGHEGPLLTDTMIVASLNTTPSEVILTSIPRDFVIESANHGFEKINAAYAYAEQAKAGNGGAAAIAAAQKVTGLMIPYYAVIDFKGFVKAVNDVGGLDITVERTFTDDQYPDYKEGYLPAVTFTKGLEHMAGERALEFVRSRHGNNDEGSDFARSERQKKILSAFKQKVTSLNLGDLPTINNLLADFTQNFRTNLEPYQIKRLSDLAKNISPDQIYSLSLEPQDDLICAGLIQDYTIQAYVVQPCEGKTLADIHQYLNNLSVVAHLKKENASIEIQNSTGKASALDNFRALLHSGINVKITTFRGRRPYDRTVVYDNTKQGKPKTLRYLQDNFTFALSDVPYFGSSADFVIILGKDAL